MGAQAIGTMGSAYAESKSIKAQSKYEAQQLELNSKLADLQAKDAEHRGKQDVANYKTEVNKLIGSQRASMAAQGIDVNDGSALDVQMDTKEMGALDALTIKNNAFREAMGFKIESVDYQGQAAMTRHAGKTAARNTLISGGIKAATDFGTGMYKSGAFEKKTPTTKSDLTYKRNLGSKQRTSVLGY